jgi:hypothetical protein
VSRILKLVVPAALTFATAALAFAAPARTSTQYVHPGESIQAAIDRARPRTTIVVATGVYRENLTITTDRITLRGGGDGSTGTVLEPPANPHRSVCSEFGEVNGICITGRFKRGTTILGKPVIGTTVSGFLVRGFSRMGLLIYNSRNTTISHNRASHNHRYGIVGFSLSGIRVLGNVADANRQGGIHIGDSTDANAVVSGNNSFGNRGSGGIGIFLRDASHGVVRSNRVVGNCVGIVFAATRVAVMKGWVADRNTVERNTLACSPAEGGGPPLSGLGIALLGTTGTLVNSNIVSGNHPTEKTPLTGGILVASSRALGGADPVRNVIRMNRLRNNAAADVVYDGSGDGNRFVRNDCRTTAPAGLCG